MIKIRTMEQEVRPVLEKVLALIEYEEDKEAFIDDFINYCNQKAIADYMELLPPSRRKILKKVLHVRNPNKLEEQLEPYIETEEFTELLQKHIHILLQNYFKAIMPKLTETQKNNLYKYFNSLTLTQQSSSSQSI